MTESQLKLHPYRLGYWARVYNLELADAFEDFADYLGSPEEQADFRQGYRDADGELKAERMEKFKSALME